MKKAIINILNKLPHVRGLHKQVELFKKNSCYPPGHFASPIVDTDDITARKEQIWNAAGKDSITGINLDVDQQLSLAKEFREFHDEVPFDAEKKEGLRFYFNNKYFTYADGMTLYSFLRYFKPKKIIEVGSGFSSALMLDTAQQFLSPSPQFTFIEPNPGRLYSLLSEADKKNTTIITDIVQRTDASYFSQLEENDFLFIDSSHVSKTGSDLNYILFQILPALKSGVLIHIHDIFYPFEYPEKWVMGGRNWNEDYLIRAFLMHNKDYRIRFFNHYLQLHHKDVFTGAPLFLKDGGGSLWIQKA